MRLYIRTLTLASLFFAPVASPAQTAADPSGHWEGTIQAPEMATKIEAAQAPQTDPDVLGEILEQQRSLHDPLRRYGEGIG